MDTQSALPAGAELHPWNRNFHWQTPAGPFRVLTEEQAPQFDRDGYVGLEKVFDASEMAEVLALIDPFELETDAFLRTRDDGRFMILETGAITFSVHLVTRAPRL